MMEANVQPRTVSMPSIPGLLGSDLNDDSEEDEEMAATAAAVKAQMLLETPDRSPAESGWAPSSSSSRPPPSTAPALPFLPDGGLDDRATRERVQTSLSVHTDDAESPAASGSDGEEEGFGCPFKRPLGARTPTSTQRREEAGARLVALAAQCRARFYQHQPRRRDKRSNTEDVELNRRQRRSISLPSMKMEAAATAALAAAAAAAEVAAADDKAEGDEADCSAEMPAEQVQHSSFKTEPGYNASEASPSNTSDASPEADRGRRPSMDMGVQDSVIIFDWDDTLFPTWFITEVVLPCMPGYEDGHRPSRSSRDVPLPSDSPFAEALRQHAITVRDLLYTARASGRVGIVTLSQRPWVTSSARRYLLGVDFEQLLKELKIPIVYARESIKRQFVCLAEVEDGVNVFAVAKQRAMQKALKKLYGKSPWRNVISVGDAHHEKDAIKELLWTIDVPDQERPPRCKTVKLMEEPSVEQLGAELLLLGMWLQSMVAHEEDFDVVMDDSEETMLRMHEQFSL